MVKKFQKLQYTVFNQLEMILKSMLQDRSLIHTTENSNTF